MPSSTGTPLSPWPSTVGMPWATTEPQPTVPPPPVWGQNPLPSRPASHEPGRNSALSATRVVTALPAWAGASQKAAHQSRAGSKPPCQHHQEASSRRAHVLLKRKRRFLHQMEHFLLNNPPILICAKKIAPCISPSCICRSLLPALNRRAAPRLPDWHVPSHALPSTKQAEDRPATGEGRRCPGPGAGVSPPVLSLHHLSSVKIIFLKVSPRLPGGRRRAVRVSMAIPFRRDGTGDRRFLSLGDGTRC